MPLKTRVTDLLEIEHPIVQGGMQGVGTAEMAAAVSNAGGLGLITGTMQPTPEALSAEIERCRGLTTKPFGVNMTVFPSMNSPDYKAYTRAIIDSGVEIVETAGTSAVGELWELMHAAGIRIIHKCTSVRHAVSAERKGVHVISIDGFECAGHPGEDDIPGLVLIPAAADQVKIPLLASGGIADGRGLAAALALGADGVNMGTRFCATQEAPIHPDVKKKYIENDERGTHLILRNFKNTARVGKSVVSDEVVSRLSKPGAVFGDVAELVSGVKGREMLKTGDLSNGIFWASMAQGLIHDIPTVKDLIDRIVADAERIIQQRLGAMVIAG